jgi:hypothetical protein
MNIDAKLPPNHGQPAAPTVTPPVHYTDGFGIASIIMAAMFFTIPGLILGIIGESKAKSHNASPVLSRIGWIANLVMLVFGIIISAVFFAFLLQHADEFKNELKNQSVNESMQKTFTTDTFTIRTPNDFSDTSNDYPDAALSLGNDADSVYLLAYTDSTSDIADGTTLAQYADKAYETFTQDTGFSEQKREQLAPGTIANPHNLEVIDYKMEANYGINKFVYYDRYIKTADGFYMLTSWTTPGQLATNLPTMKAILASFKETTTSR